MSTIVRRPPTDGPAVPPQRATEREADDLAGRLAEHLVAVALVRKAPDDPVPFAVWWRVTDALRASTEQDPAAAVAAVDGALQALHETVPGVVLTPADDAAFRPGDPARSLRHAQVLVARLVLGPAATSPTLLHVRLVRLRRALVAHATEE